MKHSVVITAILVLMFLATQYVGLYVISAYVDVEKTKETGTLTWQSLPSIAGYQLERPPLEESTSFVWIISAIIVGTILILLLIKWQRWNLWKLWYFLAVTMCMTVAFGAFVQNAFAAGLGVILGAWKTMKPNAIGHNQTELFIYAGLAAIFIPVINRTAMWILLVVISLYDMYAVWQSKHMIAMAQFQSKSGVFAGLLVPYKLGKPGTGKLAKNVKAAVLGGGDIGFPLLFSGVVMKTASFSQAAIIPIFTAASLLFLLYLGKKDRFYPAMPFISVGCLAGYLFLLW